ncbi:MAG: hypothetical protein L0207_02705 [Chlamydiae bacterium]|nr:hypothetical protein [Chlamydiota bacterium]
MQSPKTYHLYSPFSVKTVRDGQNHALLLQFILSELFHAKDAHEKDDPLEFVFSSPACFFPFDWSYEIGCLNKIHEHAILLEYAFPAMKEEADKFHAILEKTLHHIREYKKKKMEISHEELLTCLKSIYDFLEPFLLQCKENENLLFFLLKNQDTINTISYPETLANLLKKIHPKGMNHLANLLRTRYQARGFSQLSDEVDELIPK